MFKNGFIDEYEVRIIARQLCLTTSDSLDPGLVHGDLNLGHVLLDERSRVKLGDSGFTRKAENAPPLYLLWDHWVR